MRKIFFTISLLIFLLLPSVVLAQKLPLENNIYENYKDYQVAVIEEDIGSVVGIPELEGKKLVRVISCKIVPNLPGIVSCLTEQHLKFEENCTPKDWNNPFKPEVGEEKIICDRVSVVVGRGGLEMLKSYIAMVYMWAASVVGLIAVLRIVIAGIQLTVSQGAGQMEEGKNKIFQSLASLVLLFLSALILWTVNPNFFT